MTKKELLIQEAARYIGRSQRQNLVEAKESEIAADINSGLTTAPVKRAFVGHMRRWIKNNPFKSVVSPNTTVYHERPGTQLYPREITFAGPGGADKDTVSDIPKVHDHYLRGALEFYKQHGITPEVRNAMPFPFKHNPNQKNMPLDTRLSSAGTYPKYTHITALYHPETKQHLLTISGAYGGPYAKVTHAWSPITAGDYRVHDASGEVVERW